ncbi:alpha/beta hydrolase [Amycolatopsis sp. FU40]|uniref:alpha/beta fold hydrolase n=1 Tax=Amycolatopsis sp. FU40 TaxID=2914159 RepID=UPI001F436ECA|nr:alpha/beta hydrolase family protein [Amycolatopsis sp. FU40]UKD56884.1 alpha/beta hydrolase [Amycolatopsis sp. FU40]
MSHYVLVHGSWCGGWVWDRIAARLSEQGHTVAAPTLTGPGLVQHLDEVALLLEDQVVLVGHSYGGMVVAGVADAHPEQVREAIYLDAFLPSPGESAFDLMPMLRRLFAEAARSHDPPGRTVPPFGLDALGFTHADVVSRLRPIDLASHEEPLPPPSAGPRPPGRCVLFGEHSPFSAMSARAREQGMVCRTVATGHFGLWTAAAEVCAAMTGPEGCRPGPR